MTLDEIEKRLSEAAGADREIDEALTFVWFPELAHWPRSEYGGWVNPDQKMGLVAPASYYTASLDDAIGLCERMLPGWFWRVGHGSQDAGWAHLNRVHPDHCDRADEASATAATPALALCLAIVRALRHKDQANG